MLTGTSRIPRPAGWVHPYPYVPVAHYGEKYLLYGIVLERWEQTNQCSFWDKNSRSGTVASRWRPEVISSTPLRTHMHARAFWRSQRSLPSYQRFQHTQSLHSMNNNPIHSVQWLIHATRRVYPTHKHMTFTEIHPSILFITRCRCRILPPNPRSFRSGPVVCWPR